MKEIILNKNNNDNNKNRWDQVLYHLNIQRGKYFKNTVSCSQNTDKPILIPIIATSLA